MAGAQRYYVQRYGPTVFVLDGGPANDPTDREQTLAAYGDTLDVLADPTVLGQAVEAGYLDLEPPAADAVTDDEPQPVPV